MASRSLGLNDALYTYFRKFGFREDAILEALREETSSLANAVMQVTPEQGQFMAMMVRIAQVKTIVEVGTFTGYSSLSMAQALPEGGRLHTLDVSPEFTEMARRYWARAGVEHKIELHLGPAEETMPKLADTLGPASVDLAFLDADKVNYGLYYETALRMVRPGGLILVDNVFWGGSVADDTDQEPATQAIRALNEQIHADSRVDMVMASIGDGLSLVRVRDGASS